MAPRHFRMATDHHACEISVPSGCTHPCLPNFIGEQVPTPKRP